MCMVGDADGYHVTRTHVDRIDKCGDCGAIGTPGEINVWCDGFTGYFDVDADGDLVEPYVWSAEERTNIIDRGVRFVPGDDRVLRPYPPTAVEVGWLPAWEAAYEVDDLEGFPVEALTYVSQTATCDTCLAGARWLTKVCNGFLHGAILDDLVDHWWEDTEYRSHAFGRLVLAAKRRWKDRHGHWLTVAEVGALVDKALARLTPEGIPNSTGGER